MTTKNELHDQPIFTSALIRASVVGSVIGLVLIAIFLTGVSNPDPGWSRYWMLRPLTVVPIAGALGGAFCYYKSHLSHQSGWKKTLGFCAGLVGYVVILWLGFVFGLSGTLWD